MLGGLRKVVNDGGYTAVSVDRGSFLCAVVLRAELSAVCIRASDFWKLKHRDFRWVYKWVYQVN